MQKCVSLSLYVRKRHSEIQKFYIIYLQREKIYSVKEEKERNLKADSMKLGDVRLAVGGGL